MSSISGILDEADDEIVSHLFEIVVYQEALKKHRDMAFAMPLQAYTLPQVLAQNQLLNCR